MTVNTQNEATSPAGSDEAQPEAAQDCNVKNDATSTAKAIDAKPAPALVTSTVTPKPTGEVSDEALDAVAGGGRKPGPGPDPGVVIRPPVFPV